MSRLTIQVMKIEFTNIEDTNHFKSEAMIVDCEVDGNVLILGSAYSNVYKLVMALKAAHIENYTIKQ